MKTLKKLNNAIALIKSKNLKKAGRNSFSNYDYYTPSQVSELVMGACHEVGLYPKFDLVRNELGITGKLSVYDVDSDEEPIVFEMASDIPSIKATNISQQLGGAMTYTKRYLLTNAFDIADNNLDFDTTENTQKASKQKTTTSSTKEDVILAIGLCKTVEDLTALKAKEPVWMGELSVVEVAKKKQNELLNK